MCLTFYSGLVTRLVTDIFPGVAARFLADAKWHKKRYGIEPMFGLFWNLCLNAWFPGQGRIHCDPHADKKNQIGVCVLLIYVLRCGSRCPLLEFYFFVVVADIFISVPENFDHSKYTWLVIWEAGVAIELPPWTLAIYPSALFYHFNIDVDGKLFFLFLVHCSNFDLRNRIRYHRGSCSPHPAELSPPCGRCQLWAGELCILQPVHDADWS